MTMIQKKTSRGFDLIIFYDLNNDSCSLQESSLADTPSVWLGDDNCRMHLSQEMVAEILPHLTKFVKTGVLS